MKRIAIVGTVGIGKTTITNHLRELAKENNLNALFFEEKEKYTYLEKAYDDMKKYAFILQMDFLMSRLRMVNDPSIKDYDYIFYDRSYIDDYFYAERSYKVGELTEEEFNIYKTAYNKFHELTLSDDNALDLIIILQQPEAGIANERRTKRNRFEGRESNREHFNTIDAHYDSIESYEWAKQYCEDVMIIKNIDSKKTAEKIFERVK